MKYRIIILRRAEKFIRKQPRHLQEKLLKEIYKLPEGDTKRMKGHNGLYRLRVDNVRVIYTIENDVLTINVIDAGNRGQIYKRY